ncbi:hypothetical protein TMEN_4570 [Trichophyton mentagrophytes]|nr:hypothetical protein TMEN_4570 [Trichophyton mentagrophytes]
MNTYGSLLEQQEGEPREAKHKSTIRFQQVEQ